MDFIEPTSPRTRGKISCPAIFGSRKHARRSASESLQSAEVARLARVSLRSVNCIAVEAPVVHVDDAASERTARLADRVTLRISGRSFSGFWKRNPTSPLWRSFAGFGKPATREARSDAANVLFHVVNDRHRRKRPMIFTTNKPLNEWGKVLHDEEMAAAILGRVLERGRFIHLDGPSARTRHLNPEEILPAGIDRTRISGTHISSACFLIAASRRVVAGLGIAGQCEGRRLVSQL
jgi:hypothetical protein